ncbi:gamma-glutamyltranspeptidase [Vibrio ponticus]|nr:gamma-glutamyltranspeptidase [Vibrio ponticus]
MDKKPLLILSLALLSNLTFAADVADSVAPELTSQINVKQSVTAKEFVVAAAHPLAVEAGYQVLKSGGSAADALVTVQTVLGLVEPQSSGLGGGAFLVYYNAEKQQLTTYDGRETAPLTARPELFQDENGEPLKFFDAVVGGRSVGTPGTVKLLADIHRRYGEQQWASLLKPAIDLARDGFEVSERLASSIARDNERLSRYPDTKRYFFTESGQPLQQGNLLKNAEYAQTLELLAKEANKPSIVARSREISSAKFKASRITLVRWLLRILPLTKLLNEIQFVHPIVSIRYVAWDHQAPAH